jgi:deoxyhypusine synthase
MIARGKSNQRFGLLFVNAHPAMSIPDCAAASVLVKSGEVPADAEAVAGPDFEAGIDYEALVRTYKYMGFQGTQLGRVIDEVNRMVCGPLFTPFPALTPAAVLAPLRRAA